jgi:uncharacterized protein (DUF1501 family)
MNAPDLDRRRFLGEASCAALSSVPVLSTLLNLSLGGRASAQGTVTDRRSLVCIFLTGGCDTYNVLVPSDSTRHAEYAASRTNLALAQGSLQGLNFSNAGATYGAHPSMPKTAELFNGIDGDPALKRLSFLANIGTLVERLGSKADFDNGAKVLPKALFSHRDQIEEWQTSVPQGQTLLSGWAGRAADLLHDTANDEQTGDFSMPMGLSLAGNSVFLTGEQQGQFTITPQGALSFTGDGSGVPVLDAKNAAIEKMMAPAAPLEETYRDLFRRSFAKTTGDAVERGENFQAFYDTADARTVDISALEPAIKTKLGFGAGDASTTVGAVLDAADFPNNSYGTYLRAAATTVFIRDELKLRRQTLFLEFGGWDHHSELLVTQAGMLSELDGAIYAYQIALEGLGLADSTLSFSCSDFGRTLRTNGQGTDHAWSGNQFVFGKPVAGGQVLGDFPSLAIDGPDDVGRGGRLYPKLSVDEYFCELLQWFGVSGTNMSTVLPNITNFFDPTGGTKPVGFLA